MGVDNNNPIPRSPRGAVLQFGESHTAIFTANAAAIGLLPADATLYASRVTTLASAVEDQDIVKNAYRTSTSNTNKALTNMLATQGDVVRKIRAFAESSADPQAVYNLAQIPPVATPSSSEPPALPSDLKVTLDTVTGWINLSWKAENPPNTSGTSYIIKRKLPGGTWEFIGVSGVKKFTDTNFFAGPDSVQYMVTGQRGNQSGPSASITVTFGQAPGGALFVSDSKMAA